MQPLYIATERFDPSDGEKWRSYVAWANIPDLHEIVSLDTLLCSPLIHDFIDDDWKHNVQENFRLNYFYDLDYLLKRADACPRRNILGLYRNPDVHIVKAPAPAAFEFIGYDLIEESTQISALCNCGGFPETFSNDELNARGLITDFTRASEIKKNLAERHPEEHHAQCELYAIWRLNED